MTFKVEDDGHILYLGLIWVYIPNIILLGAVVRYDKKDLNVAFFSVKIDQREGQGTPAIGDMQLFLSESYF